METRVLTVNVVTVKTCVFKNKLSVSYSLNNEFALPNSSNFTFSSHHWNSSSIADGNLRGSMFKIVTFGKEDHYKIMHR